MALIGIGGDGDVTFHVIYIISVIIITPIISVIKKFQILI